MRKSVFLIFMIIFGLNLAFGEVIILKDDSVIKGKIIKLDEDNITVIGSLGEVVIERDNIKRQYATEEEYLTDLKEKERIRDEVFKEMSEKERLKLEESLRLEKERSEALLKEKAEKERIEKEKSEKVDKKDETVKEEKKIEEKKADEKKESIFVKKPLLGGGAAMISVGAVGIITGAALLGVTFGYFDPQVTDAINYKLLFREYETKYNNLIVGFVCGLVSIGVGVIMLASGIPMAVYTKKNVSLNLEVGTTTTFSFSYKF